MNSLIQKSTFDFLKSLKRNNNREWFKKNKERYLDAQTNMIQWVDALILEMNKHPSANRNWKREPVSNL